LWARLRDADNAYACLAEIDRTPFFGPEAVLVSGLLCMV
jgi:hypothetical protein